MRASTIPEEEVAVLREIAWQGSLRAAEALGLFSGNTLTVKDVQANVLAIEDVPALQGDPEEIIVGVDFHITGDISGYILAAFHDADVRLLLTSLIGEEPASLCEMGEMELSALGEAGNIIVASFLSCLESLCHVSALPSPPAVAVEMCGAILTSAVLPLVEEGGNVLMLDAAIQPVGDEGHAASCRVLFLPMTSSWEALRQAFWTHNADGAPMSDNS